MRLHARTCKHADLLAISNSTFSMAAAMLNEDARAFPRPEPDLRCLVPFDPWDADASIGKYLIGWFCSPKRLPHGRPRCRRTPVALLQRRKK
jgi:hypothetical protein